VTLGARYLLRQWNRDMRWVLFFGLIIGMMADLTLNNGDYTHAVLHSFIGFADSLRTIGSSLWGAN
jgi:hypothetical protein